MSGACAVACAGARANTRPAVLSGGVPRIDARVEVLDEHPRNRRWVTAHVVDERIARDGRREVKIHYHGWHVKWDEWLSEHSGRIVPYGTHLGNRKRRQPVPTGGVRKVAHTRAIQVTDGLYGQYLAALRRRGMRVKEVCACVCVCVRGALTPARAPLRR